eukprot:122493-Pelagomonas_calceolata.AAC.1
MVQQQDGCHTSNTFQPYKIWPIVPSAARTSFEYAGCYKVTKGFDLQPGSKAAWSAQLFQQGFQLHKKIHEDVNYVHGGHGHKIMGAKPRLEL